MRRLYQRQLGAWFEIGLPVATALACGRPSVPSIALAIFAVTFFLMHVPASLALGYFGEAARREDGWRARRQLVWLLTALLASLFAGFLLSSSRARLAMLGPCAFALLTAVLVVRHEEKTFWGQIVAGVTLSGLAFPVAIAEGNALDVAMQTWLAWVFAFSAATLALRPLGDKMDPERAQRRAMMWLAVLTLIGVGGLYAGITLGFVPALPVVVASWAIAWARPNPNKRRAMEATLAATSLVTAAVLVGLTRG